MQIVIEIPDEEYNNICLMSKDGIGMALKSTSYWDRAKCCYRSGHGFSLYRTSHRDAEQLGCPKECPLISIEDRKRMIDDIEIKLKYNKIIALQDEIARNKKQLDELWQEIIEVDKDK